MANIEETVFSAIQSAIVNYTGYSTVWTPADSIYTVADFDELPNGRMHRGSAPLVVMPSGYDGSFTQDSDLLFTGEADVEIMLMVGRAIVRREDDYEAMRTFTAEIERALTTVSTAGIRMLPSTSPERPEKTKGLIMRLMTVTVQLSECRATDEEVSLPLDFDPDAFFAYSFARSLKSDTAPNLLRARRDNDNEEQDIGVVSGEFDLTSYNAFLGGANGFMVTPYDQSGNNRDGATSGAGLQSAINTVEIGGKVSVAANGDSYYLIPAVPVGSQFSLYMAINQDDLATTPGYMLATNGFECIFSQSSPTLDDTWACYDGAGWNNVGASQSGVDVVLCYIWDNTSLSLYVNGALLNTITTGSSPSFNTQIALFANVNGASRANLRASEVILYDKAHDAPTRENICGSLVDYYGV